MQQKVAAIPEVSIENCRRSILVWTARLSSAAGAGALAILAFPPFSALPALGAFAILYALSAGQGIRTGILCGYAFGVGFFGFGLSWIAESFFVDAERFGWMAIPAVTALAVFLSLFPAAATGAFIASGRTGLRGAVIFAACWTASEWLRGHVLTGFPWNLAGYAFAEYSALRQPAALVGAYGLSFVAVLLAVLPAAALTSRSRRERIVGGLCFGLLSLITAVSGQVRLASAIPDPMSPMEPSRPIVRVVQGNVAQERKWDPAFRQEIIRKYVALSSLPGKFDLLLWPEAAFPGYLDEDPKALKAIASVLTPGAFLLTGSPDREQRDGEALFRNAVLAIDDRGSVHARYYKHHLVPFGEYVPLGHWLPIERLTAGAGAFTAGSGPTTVRLGSLPPVGISICYEAVFPGHVVDSEDRPEWMFNATNDAWFGTSIGPWQHLASARMRSVEEGLPMVRAVNTGISAVFDGYGRTVARLDLQQTGTIDIPLPPPLAPTPYSRFGDLLLLPLLFGTWIVAHLADRRSRPRKAFGSGTIAK